MSVTGNFIGMWRLVAFEERQANGEVTFPYGQNPLGLLVYDASGNMAVQIMSRQREPLSARDLSEIDGEKIRETVAGFTAFFGKYEIDEAHQIIIHRVEGHLWPASIGKDLPRVYEFSDHQLILKPSANRRVIWERVE